MIYRLAQKFNFIIIYTCLVILALNDPIYLPYMFLDRLDMDMSSPDNSKKVYYMVVKPKFLYLWSNDPERYFTKGASI